jgi:uncharacterized membrane protein YedE/YeeE
MTLDWIHFSPWSALAGGAVIGLATALYLFGNGRVAGIAGIVASPMQALRLHLPMRPELTRLAFIAGLLAASWVWRLVAPVPVATVTAGPLMLIGAGLLVGIGSRLGNGCTSGHGVCGLSRFSPRSLVNVLTFMAAGFATVFVLRHLA